MIRESMSQTLATGTFQQVNFALEMLQNQMGNQRSHWMLIPGNTQNFTGHNPEKFHLLFKLALLWSGGWPRWPSEVAPNPNYSMILKTEKISVSHWGWYGSLLHYAVWLCSNLFRLLPYQQRYLVSLHYQWSRLHNHSATDLSKA